MDAKQLAMGGAAMALTKVQGRGQVTIPSKFREALGIESGCLLLMRQVDTQRFLVDVLPIQPLDSFPIYDGEIDMEKVREEMGQEIAREVYPGKLEVVEMHDLVMQEVAASSEEGSRQVNG